jgi:hypothetical protein
MLSILNAQFDLKIDELFFSHRPQTVAFLKNARSRWEQAVHNPYSIHKSHYFLKKAMGHGSFLTTLKNYIHTLDIAVAGFQRKKATEIMTIKWAVKMGLPSKSTLYRRMEASDETIRAILDSVIPWPSPEVNHTPQPELPACESPLTLPGVAKIDSLSLLPEQELEKFKPYCLFKLSLALSQDDRHCYLSVLNLEASEFDSVIGHFKHHAKYRMKPLVQDASKQRLLQRLHDLPAGWLDAILEGTFFHDENFRTERQLIHTFVERLSVKLGKAEPDQPPRVESFDLLCHHFNQVPPILQLINLLQVGYSFKFQAPTSQKITLDDWRRALDMDVTSLPDSCIQKTTVLNPNGRLIIKLERNNKTRSKDLEAYFLLIMLHSYQTFCPA